MQQSPHPEFNKYSKLAISATKLFQKSKVKEASKPVQKLLASDWDDALHFFQTGIAAYNAKAFDVSIKLYNKTLDLPETERVKHSDVYQAMGLSFAGQGEFEKAIDCYDKGFEKAPHNALIVNNRALAYSHLRKLDKALSDLRLAFSIMPENPNILLNLIRTLKETENVTEAREILERNLTFHQKNPDVLIAAGNFRKEKEPLVALTYFRKAVYLDPKNSRILNQYASIFERVGNLRNFEGLEQDLLILLSDEAVQWKKLNRIVPSYLKSKPEFMEIQPAITASIRLNQDLNLDFGVVTKVLTDNVLLAALKRIRMADPSIEKLLELFRRQSLAALVSDIELESALIDLLLALAIPLAQYCFATEYVFSENEFEKASTQQLLQEFENSEGSNSNKTALKFVILCCYLQPHRVPHLVSAAKNMETLNLGPLNELIKKTVLEPLEEEEIKKTIPTLTPINDAISLSVQEQYEENPYPRWLHFPYLGSTDIATNLATILPALEGKRPQLPSKPQVLIAGCGTGQQPISTALAFPETDLLAVDLSLASIAYAKRKTKELKISNIEYGQADIMELGRLTKKFDIIECAGVLHHMHDPLAGWKVLCDLLHDDGFMMIGLYSEIARRDIVAARDFIKQNDYRNNLTSIRECRKELLTLEDGNLAKQVTRHGDFYATSACRDLIFHVQEHRFTIPMLINAFEQLGLEFLGFKTTLQHHEEMYRSEFPEDKKLTNLENWEKFENKHPELFSAMYKFWLRKKR